MSATRRVLTLALVLLCAVSLAVHFAAESLLVESPGAAGSVAGASDAHAEDLFLLPAFLMASLQVASAYFVLELLILLGGTISPLLPPPRPI